MSRKFNLEEFMFSWRTRLSVGRLAHPAMTEDSRIFAWDNTRQFAGEETRERLHDLLQICRAVRAESLNTPLSFGEWTDLEGIFADHAEDLIACTPVGDLWRVIALLASEAAGNTPGIGMEVHHG